MGLIFLFRRLVFFQVLLGIVAFCMAERNPGMLLVAGALGALSWYVTEGPTGRPLPQWVIIPGAFAAVAWLLADLFWQRGNVIVPMGHFTMWLQILLLYARKGNREYGEILVLSLMQMIGASVLSMSIIFGALLVAYAVLALFTLLLFQLKVTSDEVLAANQTSAPEGVQVTRPKAVVCRGHRWDLRFMAVSIGAVCAMVAIAVFMVMPRSESQMPETLNNPLGIKQTGFSRVVSLDGPPLNASGMRDPVLHMTLTLDGRALGSDELGWLLRGAALDQYDTSARTWKRSVTATSKDMTVTPTQGVNLAEVPADTPSYQAALTVRGGTEGALFTLHPVVRLTAPQLPSVEFNPLDQQLSIRENRPAVVRYAVQSPVRPLAGLQEAYLKVMPANSPTLIVRPNSGQGIEVSDTASYAKGINLKSKSGQVRKLAQDVLKRAGLERDINAQTTPQDDQIAQTLADYLRDNYRYDLSNPKTADDQEPIAEFLLNHKRGHCELFASGLAAMARSVGMRARVITGYRASEFNRIGGYYVARQSNAHAWVEVVGSDGNWHTFDPTPPDLVAAEHEAPNNFTTFIRQLYEHMEYTWLVSVVAYNADSREKLMGNVNQSLRGSRPDGSSRVDDILAWIKGLPERWQFDQVSYAIMGTIAFFIIVGVASLVNTLVARRRRLVALQLTRLPRKQRRALAQRLRFYLLMLDMLERHGYVRPTWQSPFGFAQELADANPMRFDPVVALTEIFYEIRFGHRELDDDRRNRVRAHLRQLEHALAQKSS